MWKEFKEFAMKGNIVDMAIGVIIGGAFQKVVNSLVSDVIMPFISIFTGKLNYNDLSLTIGNVSIKYGSFLTTILNFLIIAFSIFLTIRYINKLNKTLEEKAKNLNQKLETKSSKLFSKKSPSSTKSDSREEPTIQTEETTKSCPYCYSTIPILASRCPHCTSVLEETMSIQTEETLS